MARIEKKKKDFVPFKLVIENKEEFETLCFILSVTSGMALKEALKSCPYGPISRTAIHDIALTSLYNTLNDHGRKENFYS